jgi:hypothetical protein
MLIYLGAADGADRSRRKAFLYGCRYDGIERKPDQQALLRIRRATSQYLYPATPMDTLGLSIDGGDSIRARLFVCDPARTRGAVVTILNEARVRGATITVDTSAFGPVRSAWIADADGRDGPLTDGVALPGGNAFRIPVPAAFASSVLLLNRAEPRVAAHAAPLLARDGETVVNARLESLTGETVKGRVRLRPPRGFSARSVRFVATGSGQAQAVVELPLLAGEKAPLGLVDIPIEIDVDGGPRFRKVVTVCVEEPVRVTPEWVGPEKLRVAVENRSRSLREGDVSLEMAYGEVAFAGEAPAWQYRLAPGESARFESELRGGFGCQVPWAVKGRARCGKRTFPIYAPFRPPILNGSMERRRFREDIPDYWWGTYVDRRPALFGRGEFGFDDAVAADGRWSLKVVGKADEWRAAHLDTVLQPVTRYRFHVKIRRTVNSPKIYASIWEGRRLPDGKVEGVAHVAGQQTIGPLNEWQTFETTFVSLPAHEQAGCRLYLYNMNTPGTVWYDDVRLVPEEE